MRLRRLVAEQLESRNLFDGNGVEVTPTHVITAYDKVPRFAANAEYVAVSSGKWSDPLVWNRHVVPGVNAKVSIPHDIDVDYDLNSSVKLNAIEVSGRLDFETDVDTSLWLSELMVMPDGALTIGQTNHPVAQGISSEIVFVDAPLKTSTIDPAQYGVGLLVFGQVTMHGQPLDSTFVRVAGDALAGARQISLQKSVVDWRVGDSIVIPDTRHVNPLNSPGYYTYKPQWETRLITAVDGKFVTLDRALQYDHKGPRDADGFRTVNFDGDSLAAHVGNLSRNVVLRSENPSGVRGHTQYFANAGVDIRYVSFNELGRTRVGPLDNTKFDASGNVTHIGTNQVGRYSQHLHHVQGPQLGLHVVDGGPRYQWILIGNAINGSGKWGTAIHDSHFGLLQSNNYYNIDGAAVATEDGSEFGNLLNQNFVVRINGGAGSFDGFGLPSVDRGDLGDGFWFAGPLNIVQNNVVANAYHEAYTVWPDNTPNTRSSHLYREVEVPVSPGSPLTRTVNILEAPFDKFFGNEAYGATTTAVGIWGVGDRTNFPQAKGSNTLTNTVVWHVTGAGIVFYYASTYSIDGWIQRGDPYMIQRGAEDGGPSNPSIGAAMLFGGALAESAKVTRANIQNMTYGFVNRGRGLADELELSSSYFDNHYNVLSWPFAQEPIDGSRDFHMKNVRFGDAANPGSHNTIDMQWLPATEQTAITPESFNVTDFNGKAGVDLRVYYLEQAPGVVADKVPAGNTAVSKIAPTLERDGDNGQAATIRGKAMGITGLVFETGMSATPVLFANVESYFGKPTLFYTVLGKKTSVAGVQFVIAGRTINKSELSGIIDLDFISARGKYQIQGYVLGSSAQLSLSRELVLPLRTAPSAGNTNRAPVLAPIGEKNGVANSAMDFSLVASDPDFDELRFQVSGLPSTAQFDTRTGRFTWKPTNSEAGEYFTTFTVLDSKGLSASERVKISVAFDAVSSLVGSWPLNQVDTSSKTVDISVYGQHGSGTNVVPNLTKGLSFNGRDSRVTVNRSLAFQPSRALTISIEARPVGNQNNFSRMVGMETGSISGYELTVKDGGYSFDARGPLTGYWFSINTEKGLRQVSWRSQVWSKPSFDKVVGVFDGSKNGGWMAIYVNGALADELSEIGTTIKYPSFGTQQVLLGGRANQTQMFAGVLANAKIMLEPVTPGTSSDALGLRGAEGESPMTSATIEFQDVNADGHVSPLDALQVINFLKSYGSVELDAFMALRQDSDPNNGVDGDRQWRWLDVNRDGNISPLDALQVINRLNKGNDLSRFDTAIEQLVDSTFGLEDLRKKRVQQS